LARRHPPAADETAPVIAGLPSGTVVDDEPLQPAITPDDAESGIRSLVVTVGCSFAETEGGLS